MEEGSFISKEKWRDSVDDEETREKEKQAEMERQQAVEEWSEIELKFQNGIPPPIITSQPTVHSDCEKAAFSSGTKIEVKSAVLRELFDIDYTREKDSFRILFSPTPQQVPFLKRCVCRSNMREILKSGDLQEERLTLLALSATPYLGTLAVHWKLLSEFYRRAMASDDSLGSSTCARTGPHWQSVGFQGMDPSTDLRGAGVLGLVQLYCLVTETLHKHELENMITLSRHDEQNFPFAVVGINFTSLIIDYLKTDQLNGLANDYHSFLTVINLIYRGCFVTFYKEWKTRGCTIIDFHSVLTGVKEQLKKDPAALITVKLDE